MAKIELIAVAECGCVYGWSKLVASQPEVGRFVDSAMKLGYKVLEVDVEKYELHIEPCPHVPAIVEGTLS